MWKVYVGYGNKVARSDSHKTKHITEYGDFQTPTELASTVMDLVAKTGISPRTVIEPTCGRGAFLFAAIKSFPATEKFIGVEINQAHINELKKNLIAIEHAESVEVIQSDFFIMDWSALLSSTKGPLLVVGNPPWVTNAELGVVQGSNMPKKSNFQRLDGLDAQTGKSNFDISEWMILQNLGWLKQHSGSLAVLCKTAVARRVLSYAWRHAYPISAARIYGVDVAKHFGVSVEACLFVVDMNGQASPYGCDVFDRIIDTKPSSRFGYEDGSLVAHAPQYMTWRRFRRAVPTHMWRSGIKHDCSKVMELERTDGVYRNGYGAKVDLEDEYTFPMFKGSEVANGRIRQNRRYMLITQKTIGEDTSHIEKDSPRTWKYLNAYSLDFANRSSSIYTGRPPFSIFGVGNYTFAPWKVAISGFQKTLHFVVIGPLEGRPVVFDDTVNFLACWHEGEANFMAGLLNSRPAREFLNSMIFWNNKRPITIDVLDRLDLQAVAHYFGQDNEYAFHVANRLYDHTVDTGQLRLLHDRE